MSFLHSIKRRLGVKCCKLISGLIAGFSFYAATAQSSAEINMGSNRLGVEMSMRYYLDHQKKWNASTFNRAFYHHQDKTTGFFTFSSIGYFFKSGLGLSANLTGSDTRFYTTLGAHYEKNIRHFYLHLLVTYALFSTSLNEDYIILAYKLPLNKKTKLISQFEFYTLFEKWTHDDTYERIKLGFELNRTQIGFFNESLQNSEKMSLSTNIGCYLKRSF